jgi:hypothetical protein
MFDKFEIIAIADADQGIHRKWLCARVLGLAKGNRNVYTPRSQVEEV